MIPTKLKRGGIIALLAVTLLPLGLAACGIPQEEYDAALARADGLAADKTDLEAKVASLTSQKAGFETQVASLTSAGTALEADKAVLETENDTLNANLTDLQEQYNAAVAELEALNRTYPPRQFANRDELETWLAGNDISELPPVSFAEDWYGRALDVQEAAAADGYLISADLDYNPDGDFFSIWCTTVIDGELLLFSPESDETGFSGFGSIP